MSTDHPTETPRSPVPGVIPDPVRVEHEPPTAEPARRDPGAERDARRHAREERREPQAQRPEVRTAKRRKRPPLDTPRMRAVSAAGIVAIAVVVAVILGSLGAAAWLIGLATSLITLVLAAVLAPARGS